MQATVSELSGAALDYAVAKCEGSVTELVFDGITHGFNLDGNPKVLSKGWAPSMSWHPSSNWLQGGTIVEREGILLRAIRKPGHSMDGQWLAMYDGTNTGSLVQWRKAHYSTGPTPLIAAMRCLVKIKLGDEIEVPDFLANMTV